ncbi:MAG: L-seryl-tRNA(Sec) selenium transferase, partial [Anaerolineae bacterium]|nr:L-seryl-tRNA(Sec) selenium transferase [Anaerolineae bacterium]
MSVNERLRALPSVDSLLQHDISQQLTGQYGQVALRDAIRARLDDIRQRLLSDEDTSLDSSDLMRQVAQQLQDQFQPTLRPVINASGVILHTNLGRAPLSQSAQEAILAMASQYNNLEYDLEQGRRGSRYVHAEELLCEVTGAQAALVVNNNASALVLILSALAKEAGVVISRGQLVEIGGGFRIPDIMAQSGARLIEVGTTNRTRIGDYEAALDEATSMLLRVHSSNFRLLGFVESAELSEMTALAHNNNNLICVDDLGSGALLDTAEYGLLHEPMVQESLSAGADVICFSGDKLLGGPQAGIIVGRADLITRLKKHPLARALRVDKL